MTSADRIVTRHRQLRHLAGGLIAASALAGLLAIGVRAGRRRELLTSLSTALPGSSGAIYTSPQSANALTRIPRVWLNVVACGRASLSRSDQLCPAVGRFGNPLDVAEPLELIHVIADRRRRHIRRAGEVTRTQCLRCHAVLIALVTIRLRRDDLPRGMVVV